MASLDLMKTLFGSDYAGLAQVSVKDFSVAVPSVSWASGAGATFFASTPITITSEIPEVYFQLTGISTRWYLLNGFQGGVHPENATIGVNDEMSISISSYVTGGNLTVRMSLINAEFMTMTRPAFTLTCKAYVDSAPF